MEREREKEREKERGKHRERERERLNYVVTVDFNARWNLLKGCFDSLQRLYLFDMFLLDIFLIKTSLKMSTRNVL